MKNNILKIIKDKKLKNLDLKQYSEKYDLGNNNIYLCLEAGKEHYQLLANISNCLNNAILFDIGTLTGASALALAFNKNNKVKSYDIKNHKQCEISEENINFVIGDVLKDKDLIKSDLILLDTFHDGSFEKVFLDFLIEKNYNGVVILDDTIEWIELKNLITEFKTKNPSVEVIDITDIGHYTGTTALIF